MPKQRKTVASKSKLVAFTIGRAHFVKISAVEGIKTTEVMEKRASEASRTGMTAAEYRSTIMRSYRKS